MQQFAVTVGGPAAGGLPQAAQSLPMQQDPSHAPQVALQGGQPTYAGWQAMHPMQAVPTAQGFAPPPQQVPLLACPLPPVPGSETPTTESDADMTTEQAKEIADQALKRSAAMPTGQTAKSGKGAEGQRFSQAVTVVDDSP